MWLWAVGTVTVSIQWCDAQGLKLVSVSDPVTLADTPSEMPLKVSHGSDDRFDGVQPIILVIDTANSIVAD